MRQWQDMLHLIVKQLQLSENLNKIVGDIKRLEEEVGKVLMGRPPPPVMHNKSDLEKDIEGLKVSCNGWYTTTLQWIVSEYIVENYYSLKRILKSIVISHILLLERNVSFKIITQPISILLRAGIKSKNSVSSYL